MNPNSHHGKMMSCYEAVRIKAKERILNCKKCEKEYILFITDRKFNEGEYRKHCSRSCANGRIHTEETKSKISISSLSSSRVEDERVRRKNTVYASYIDKICPTCKMSFKVRPHKRNKIYCNRKCAIKDAKGLMANRKNIGGYREGSGIGKRSTYKGFNMDSTLELSVAKYLDVHNFNWIKNTKRFYLEWNGVKTYYIPDFYFPDLNLYLETKGFWWKDKKEKTLHAAFVNGINLVFLLQKDWERDNTLLLTMLSLDKKTEIEEKFAPEAELVQAAEFQSASFVGSNPIRSTSDNTGIKFEVFTANIAGRDYSRLRVLQ